MFFNLNYYKLLTPSLVVNQLFLVLLYKLNSFMTKIIKFIIINASMIKFTF